MKRTTRAGPAPAVRPAGQGLNLTLLCLLLIPTFTWAADPGPNCKSDVICTGITVRYGSNTVTCNQMLIQAAVKDMPQIFVPLVDDAPAPSGNKEPSKPQPNPAPVKPNPMTTPQTSDARTATTISTPFLLLAPPGGMLLATSRHVAVTALALTMTALWMTTPTLQQKMGDKFYVVMVDPDAPTATPCPKYYWLHWAVHATAGVDGKLAYDLLSVEYAGPTPPPGSGVHRYMIFIYRTTTPTTHHISLGAIRENFDLAPVTAALGQPFRTFQFKVDGGAPSGGGEGPPE